MDPDSLAEARGRLKPVEGGQEDPVYAEVHHEDPDAIRVVQEEPEAALEAASQAGSGAAALWRSCCRRPSPAAWAGSGAAPGATSSGQCKRRTSCPTP